MVFAVTSITPLPEIAPCNCARLRAAIAIPSLLVMTDGLRALMLAAWRRKAPSADNSPLRLITLLAVAFKLPSAVALPPSASVLACNDKALPLSICPELSIRFAAFSDSAPFATIWPLLLSTSPELSAALPLANTTEVDANDWLLLVIRLIDLSAANIPVAIRLSASRLRSAPDANVPPIFTTPLTFALKFLPD